jgi:response regulator RpfG family c-di-GMP phosphodiesterase
MERKSVDQILVVDTDTKVLEAFVRLFQHKGKVVTHTETEGALKWLKENGGVSVIVTALNVPGRGGSAFLHAAELLAPQATRIILTTETSVDRLKEAVNERHIFMFLNKPCSATEITAAVDAALAYHAQLAYERQMLEKTLSGSVKLLIEMLALFHTEAFRRTPIMRAQALKIAKRLSIKRTWELEMAVMFSPLGEALLPREILGRYRAAKTLTDQERRVLATAPAQTKQLLKNIPQLEKVAEVLYLSGRGFDGSGFPEDGPIGKDIPLNSRIIKLLTDLWYASPETGVDAAAFEALTINKRQYDPHLLEIAKACLLDEVEAPLQRKISACYIRALKPGDILVDDALTEGTHELVLSSGHVLTETTIRRLEQFDKVTGVRQPIRVHRAAKQEEMPKAVNA